MTAESGEVGLIGQRVVGRFWCTMHGTWSMVFGHAASVEE